LVLPTPEHDVFVASLRTHPDTRKYLCHLPGPDKFNVEAAKERRVTRAKDDTVVDWIIMLKESEGREVEAGSMCIQNSIRNEYKDECELGILVCEFVCTKFMEFLKGI
jgi:hypothetical protein